MRVLPSLFLVLGLVLITGTPDMSQGLEEEPLAPVSYSQGAYTVLEDGTLIYEGDMVFTCDYLLEPVGGTQLPPDPGALEACIELGHVPSASNSALPNTGGVPLSMVGVAPVLAGGLALAGARLLRVTRYCRP